MIMKGQFTHTPVLFNEVIENLQIQANGIYIDATLGRGGHTLGILSRLNSGGHVYGFDIDETAIEYFRNIVKKYKITNCTLFHQNFTLMNYMLGLEKVGKVNGILFDLGVSSPQLDDLERGFSYHGSSLLDMRMDQSQTLNAHQVINHYSQKELVDIFRSYGEEPFASVIANNIVKQRMINPINRTDELVQIIKNSLPQKILKKQKHPARQVFQAIRIAVNDELRVIKIALKQATDMLAVNGRLVVITFHSLEDRIVKQYFKQICHDPEAYVYNKLPYTSNWQPKYRIVNSHIIVATPEEQKANKRSRSAKLRILERIAS